MPNLPRFAHERWLLAGCLLLVVAVHAATIWSVPWLPMGDYGGHLELMDIVARHDDPSTAYAETYTLPTHPRPNTMSLVLAQLLGGHVATLTLGHLLVTLYVVGLPLSLGLVARAFGRSPWAALLAAPLTFNAVLNVGFLNYLLGLPLIFTAVALARFFVNDGTTRPRRAATAAALAVTLAALFFAHAIALLIGVAIVAAVIVLHARTPRELARLWPVLVPAPLMIPWIVEMFVARQATETGRTFATETGLGLVFDPPLERLAQIHAWGMQFFRSSVDAIAFALLVALWVLWLVAGRRRARPAAEPTTQRRWLQWLRAYDLEVLTACCFAAFMVLPSHMNEMGVLHHRTLILTLLFAAVWPRLRPGRHLATPLVGAALVLAVGYPMVVSTHFHRFVQHEVGRLPQMLGALPQRSRLLYVQLELRNRVTHMGPLWHLPRGIHTTLNGGLTDNSFAIRPYTPVQYRPGHTPVQLSPRGARAVESPHLLEQDFVLVRSTPAPDAFLRSEFLRLVEQDAHWWLFEVDKIDPDGVRLHMAGDAGGRPRVATCPGHSELIGLKVGVAEDRIASLLGLCGNASTGRLTRTTPRLGRRGLAPSHTLRCADGARLIGLRGTVAHGVRALGLLCEPAAGEPEAVVAGEAPQGRAFELRCEPGTAPDALQLRSGNWIDAVGIGCK